MQLQTRIRDPNLMIQMTVMDKILVNLSPRQIQKLKNKGGSRSLKSSKHRVEMLSQTVEQLDYQIELPRV
jgi:hypothetical protein